MGRGRARQDRVWRGGGPRVLVAEPVDDDREALCGGLRGEGYQVAFARTGFEVFDLLANTLLDFEPMGFELIVSAQRMPGWSGLDVLQGLRRIDWATPFLLLVREPDPIARAGARRWGGFVFERPLEVAELVGYVRCLVPPFEVTPAQHQELLVEEVELTNDERGLDRERVWSEIEAQLRREGLMAVRPREEPIATRPS